MFLYVLCAIAGYFLSEFRGNVFPITLFHAVIGPLYVIYAIAMTNHVDGKGQ